MTKYDKLIKRFLSKPKDFRYSEVTNILVHLGYKELKTGKTAGSRNAFINEKSNHIIRFHKPHPKDIMKQYQIDYLIEELKKKELI
jgi:hypothetical protein